MLPKSSSVNSVNFGEKICYNSRDIDNFPMGVLFGTPCTCRQLQLSAVFSAMFYTDRQVQNEEQKKLVNC